jgi:hypothetical protein
VFDVLGALGLLTAERVAAGTAAGIVVTAKAAADSPTHHAMCCRLKR